MSEDLNVLVGDFDDRSASRLHNLVKGSPTKFLDHPKVFFSIPKKEVVTDISVPYIDVVFDGNDTLLNPVSSLSELIVYLKPVSPQGDTLKRQAIGTFKTSLTEDSTTFRPYFCWILDPNRSMRVQRYCVTVIQALASDPQPFRLNTFLVGDTGPTASRFNKSTLSANPPKSIYSE